MLSFLKVCLYGCYTNRQFYRISLFHQLNIVFREITENHFQVKIKDCIWAAYEVLVKFKTPFIWHKFHSNLYIYLHCIMYFKKYFFKKKDLKAIPKVDMNFNELHVKFNMQSFKKWFSLILWKTYVQLTENWNLIKLTFSVVAIQTHFHKR